MKIAHCGWTILAAAICAAGLCLATLGAAASAQQSSQDSQASRSTQSAPPHNGEPQTDPLAAAARRAREKQKEQTNPAKVWDNDNLPTAGDVNVVGPPAPSSSTEAAAGSAEQTAEESATPATGSTAKIDKSELEAQLKSAKDNLKRLQSQLDFAQRKLALDQQTFYQNPNYASDRAGAQALKDEQSQIDAQKQQVDAAQKKVDELTSKLQAQSGTHAGATAPSADETSSTSTGKGNSNGSSPQ